MFTITKYSPILHFFCGTVNNGVPEIWAKVHATTPSLLERVLYTYLFILTNIELYLNKV